MDRPKTTTGEDILKKLAITPPTSPVRRIVKGLLWISAATIAMLSAGWFFSESETKTQYATQPSILGGLSVVVSATGNLAPTNEVEVGSELSGIVKQVEADYNDHVKMGQILARLDTAKLDAQVLQSKASLEAAKAKVLLAKATVKETQTDLSRLKRLQEISTGKGVSQQDIDAAAAKLERAVAEEASAQAEVSRSKAALEANESDLSKTVIRSPVNGVVLDRSIEPGQTVAASLEAPVLFTLAEDLKQMELLVDVDEADVGKVQEGQEATFTVDAYPDRKFPARIIQVRFGATSNGSNSKSTTTSSTSTSSGVVTYKTVLNVNNADLSLRPGMTATAEITVEKVEAALLAPNAALRFSPDATESNASEKSGIMSKLMPRPPRPEVKKNREQNGVSSTSRVWVLDNDQPKPIAVKTGPTDGKHTVIKEGDVLPGTPLIVDATVEKK